jgi:hypothetical protein
MAKVREVIESLREFDPEDEVLVIDSDGATYEITDYENDGPFVMIEVSSD